MHSRVIGVRLVWALVLCVAASRTLRGQPPSSWPLFPSGSDFYNYAPSAVEDETLHWFWWCQNTDSRQICDYIYARRFDLDTREWSGRRLALSPGAEGAWDGVHVCDPSVVRTNSPAGVPRWHLFYLGTDQLDNRHNQVGVATAPSPDGPWERATANPVVPAGRSTWGAGQPSAVRLGDGAEVALFFTRQHDDLSTATYLVRMDMSTASVPVVSEALRLPEAGLTGGVRRIPGMEGIAPVLHNADVVLDPWRARLWLVCPVHPFPTFEGRRSNVAGKLQVAWAPVRAVLDGTAVWTVTHTIGQTATGHALNHNACFGRTPEGFLPVRDGLRLNITTARPGRDALWTYSLRGLVLRIEDEPRP